MRTTHIITLSILLCLLFGNPLNAQTCGPEPVIDPDGFEGIAFFNYGSTSRSKSNSYKTAFAVGQTFTGFTEGLDTNTFLGFYARNLLPPFALKVKATQGDLLDRIQVSWEVDQLGPSPSKGFSVLRDGIKIYETDDPGTRNYNDFNVIAGRAYTYCVQGRNIFGDGVCAEAIGFQVPNGVVTGWISTQNGTPVPDATVSLTRISPLTPTPGFSARFDTGDGAMVMSEMGTNPFLPALDQNWTITFWMKTDASAINGKLIGMDSLFIRLRPGNTGLAIAKTAGGSAFLFANFPDNNTLYDWHHVALTYDGNGNKYRLYFDGDLVGITSSGPAPPPDTITFGALAGTGTWKGRLDDLRFYNHKLDELDFDMVMEATASAQTPYLTHYWKMDEELGVKSYDIVKRHKFYFCGAEFDDDIPPVKLSAITNVDGYYRIESASYSTGTTFLATPKKNFYLHRALKFEKAETDTATLPDFPITQKATIEMWVNSAGVDGFQCLLSKRWGASNEFRIVLAPNGTNYDVRAVLNENSRTFGLLGSNYQHLAFRWDSTSRTMTCYKNGVILGTPQTFPLAAVNSGNWSDPAHPWFLGIKPDGTLPYGGLIDEVAFYDTTLSVQTIQNHFGTTRDIQETGLRVYFPLDEGSGTRINNAGSLLLPGGTTFGTEWSPLSVHQVITPHEFAPSTRQVTLNPSVTSVDQVDFTDRSTIGVIGYVRYTNTDCFAPNVEILVNGASFHPKVLTDSTGKFVIDFDPGTSAILTPKLEDHLFMPAFWEITNVNSPIVGILFNDMTTRKISGIIAGNKICKKAIIANPPGTAEDTRCRVQVRSVDGCLEREILVTNQDGVYEFDDLPPIEKMTVSIIEFSNQKIKNAFDIQGGHTVDLSENDTMHVDFIYTAPPKVEIVSGLDTVQDCTPQKIVLEEGLPVVLKIKPYEQYEITYDDMDMVVDEGVCYIDTASFHIINSIAGEDFDTSIVQGILIDTFVVGDPNPTPPFLKNLQIVVKNNTGQEGSLIKQVIVTGIKAKLQTFTTLLPEIPTVILRDPPGDGSYSYLEKDEKICKTHELINELEVGGGGGVQLQLGGTVYLLNAPLGIGTEIVTASHINIDFDANLTYERLSSSSFETCLSFDSRIATSDDDLIVGGERGGDLYMGDAINIVYGFADAVTYDYDLCKAEVDTVINVEPGNFATVFIYSQFYIEGTIIPSLTILYEDPETPATDTARYGESIRRWEAILNNNAVQKENARFVKNISFDAGTEIEYSETSDTTSTETLTELINNDFTLETNFGGDVNNLGLFGTIRILENTSNGGRNETGIAKGITTGYVLKDDDPLDAFTFDVGMDSVYKTPVFNLKAGQSSCPWEPGTANREGTNLNFAPGYSNEVINVPSNEAAVFKLILGNLSATNEAWTYSFTSIAANNPDGAIIKLNGQPLNYLQEYEIPYGDSQAVTITIERGPVEYIYDDLLVAEISACEYERHLALTIPLDDDPKFFTGLNLSVHFIRPCSEVEIHVPEQNWVVTNATGPTLPITVSGYDLTNSDFKSVKVQWRRSDGDGTWNDFVGTITQRFNPNWSGYTNQNALGPVFTQFNWNTNGFEDGDYEIHAWAICDGTAVDKPGFSQIIKGRIDRDPPKIIGVPQPSDGVLQVGDEISFTFNEPINCDEIVEIDDIKLFDSTTGELITNYYTCSDNKIIIDPLFLNEEYENHILRAELHNIEDHIGNTIDESIEWEFYLDRNELAWLTDSAGITKYEDETKSITVKMHNRGGYPVPFTIDAPDWVHVTPDAGTLVANEIRDIQFTAGDTLDVEWFKDSITLTTEIGENPFFMGGVEKLPFDVRNMCRPPDWVVNTSLYQQTMTLCLRIKIDNGPFSEDPEDQIAAFINGQLRGTAKLTKTNVPAPNTWVAFMTLYGNAGDAGKDVIFELFDADACLHYPARFAGGDTITFTENGTQGTPNSPRTLINTGLLIHEIPVKTGWNWISFNLGFPNSAINQVLNNIYNPSGDLIKDKTTFSTNNNNTWVGSLTNIGNKSMYMYQSAKNNTIKITGNALNPPTDPITLVAGAWNWIGYMPDDRIPINIALASITPAPTAGDVIKSQNSFAQYVNNTTKWVGSLTHLQAPNGYLMRSASGGTLTYPASFSGDNLPSRRIEPRSSYWNMDASKFEHNMTLIGVFEYDETNATTSGMELGAFVGNELRGASEAVYVDVLDSYIFFLTTFANKSGEQIHFKLYDPGTGEELELKEKMTFTPNYHQGNIEAPVPFTLQTTGFDDVMDEFSFDVQPNPFRDETQCRIELPSAQDVRLIVTDMDGKILYIKQLPANTGMNTFSWKGCTTAGTPLSNGIYLIRMETEQGILTKPVVLQR